MDRLWAGFWASIPLSIGAGTVLLGAEALDPSLDADSIRQLISTYVVPASVLGSAAVGEVKEFFNRHLLRRLQGATHWHSFEVSSPEEFNRFTVNVHEQLEFSTRWWGSLVAGDPELPLFSVNGVYGFGAGFLLEQWLELLSEFGDPMFNSPEIELDISGQDIREAEQRLEIKEFPSERRDVSRLHNVPAMIARAQAELADVQENPDATREQVLEAQAILARWLAVQEVEGLDHMPFATQSPNVRGLSEVQRHLDNPGAFQALIPGTGSGGTAEVAEGGKVAQIAQ